MLRVLKLPVGRRNQAYGLLQIGSKRHHSSRSQNGFVLGILRETYNIWERRAPLCPTHVKNLLSQDNGLKQVMVQPSNSRIFRDSEYELAGATIQEDLSGADWILGVKRPIDDESLIPNKAYAFFSHVIKGQPENMNLLQHVLQNSIQLFDYECIVQRDEKDGKSKRLVAFGKYAGMSGMNDALHALGQRFLWQGYSTPFLQVPLAYSYEDWNTGAKSCLRRIGKQISDGEGLPMKEPLVVCLTGKGGNVHEGAMEVLKELPLQTLTSKDELSDLWLRKGPHKCVYVLSLGVSDLFERKDGSPFDRKDYQDHPMKYRSNFAEAVAPFTTVLVNTAFWNERFPRVLTKADALNLSKNNSNNSKTYKPPLQLVADISCDVNGSIEFLHRTTSIEKPFFEYDPYQDREIADVVTGEGITVAGVDILPSELPRESSEHFGDALLPLVINVIENASDAGKIDFSNLCPELKNACVATDGQLTSGFEYISTLMNRQRLPGTKLSVSMVLSLHGHIFDTNLINQSLDVIEGLGCGMEVLECQVACPKKSFMLLRVSAVDEQTLQNVYSKLSILADVLDAADATVTRQGFDDTKKKKHFTQVRSMLPQKVLLLGSGMVSGTVIEYLGRDTLREVTVVGIDEVQTRSAASSSSNAKAIVVDVLNNTKALEGLIDQADVVISLLPSSFHSRVAELCIDKRKDLVTASYESDSMRELDQRAKSAGITILNEVGLDPGLDHMSAMRIIDGIHHRGGVVTQFESYCGGLPSPNASNNPLKYKFSWSPKGVLSACLNSARYMVDGDVIEINGGDLLSSSESFRGPWNDVELEYLANRDSMIYMDRYGIQSANTCFRGTLRYTGFSSLMNTLRALGLFSERPVPFVCWEDMLRNLRQELASGGSIDDLLLQATGGDYHLAKQTSECIQFLRIHGQHPLAFPGCLRDSFCHALEERMKYEPGEKDMVLMHHKIVGTFPGEQKEAHSSSLRVFGDGETSAMAKTVGYTTAIAAELVLQRNVKIPKGLVLPTVPEIYTPVLHRTSEEGIVFDEQCAHYSLGSTKDSDRRAKVSM